MWRVDADDLEEGKEGVLLEACGWDKVGLFDNFVHCIDDFLPLELNFG